MFVRETVSEKARGSSHKGPHLSHAKGDRLYPVGRGSQRKMITGKCSNKIFASESSF